MKIETDALGFVVHDGTRRRWLTDSGRWVGADEARRLGEMATHWQSEKDARDALAAAPAPQAERSES